MRDFEIYTNILSMLDHLSGKDEQTEQLRKVVKSKLLDEGEIRAENGVVIIVDPNMSTSDLSDTAAHIKSKQSTDEQLKHAGSVDDNTYRYNAKICMDDHFYTQEDDSPGKYKGSAVLQNPPHTLLNEENFSEYEEGFSGYEEDYDETRPAEESSEFPPEMQRDDFTYTMHHFKIVNKNFSKEVLVITAPLSLIRFEKIAVWYQVEGKDPGVCIGDSLTTVNLGDATIRIFSDIEYGEYKASINLVRKSKDHGYSISDMREKHGGLGGHITQGDENVMIHLIPLMDHNNTKDGYANCMCVTEKDGRFTAYTMKDHVFRFRSGDVPYILQARYVGDVLRCGAEPE